MTTFDEHSLTPWLPELIAARQVLVGFSGGLDSTVLLHALCRVLAPDRITAIHVNHGLSVNADSWQAHCEAVCQRLGVALETEKVTVVVRGKGLEEAAREQRYKVFARHLRRGDLVLLAHHRDDQIETVLFRLLRGSGPRGLAGMPQRRPLGAGEVLRPLLTTGREALHAWACSEGLAWIDDESNSGTDVDRNFLRHQVLPLLAGRWPDLDRRILRSASLCRDSAALLGELAEADLAAFDENPERLGWSIPIAAIQHLSVPRQTNLLRSWVAGHGLPPPGHRPLAAVLDDLLPARDDAAPQVCFGAGHFRRYAGRLFLLPGAAALLDSPGDTSPGAVPLAWPPVKPLALPGGFTLGTRDAPGGLCLAAGATLEVRFRHGGERCRPAGRSGSRSLKKLLQEYRLEPWLRHLAPLIYVDGELAAVADLFVCDGFLAAEGEPAVALSWTAC